MREALRAVGHDIDALQASLERLAQALGHSTGNLPAYHRLLEHTEGLRRALDRLGARKPGKIVSEDLVTAELVLLFERPPEEIPPGIAEAVLPALRTILRPEGGVSPWEPPERLRLASSLLWPAELASTTDCEKAALLAAFAAQLVTLAARDLVGAEEAEE